MLNKKKRKKDRTVKNFSFFNKIKSFFKYNLFKQIIFTFACLFIFLLGSNIFVSSVNIQFFDQVTGLSLYDMLTGSDLSGFSLFALGLSPFITSSIIIELLSNDIIPSFTHWKNNGETKKKNTATNIFGLIIAFIQSTVYVIAMY